MVTGPYGWLKTPFGSDDVVIAVCPLTQAAANIPAARILSRSRVFEVAPTTLIAFIEIDP
jgi:hypothetical protein